MRAHVLLSALALLSAGCSALVSFDRSRIDPADDGGIDAGLDSGIDAGLDSGIDAGLDSGIDAGPDSGIDAGPDNGIDAGPDSGIDGGIDGGSDAGPDAPPVTCDPTTHAGCRANELCCDADGRPTCVSTGASQCTACGVPCEGRSSDSCEERTCRCGTGPACMGSQGLCDAASGDCVECRGAGECEGDRPCVGGRCRACDPSDDAGCGGATPICDAATFTCRACTAGDCAIGVCVTEGPLRGACGACDPAATGVCPAETPVCAAATATCVGCTTTEQCGAITAGRECITSGASAGRCEACNPATGAGCGGTTPLCTSSFTCVACVVDTDCDTGGGYGCDVTSRCVCTRTGESCPCAVGGGPPVSCAEGEVCDPAARTCT